MPRTRITRPVGPEAELFGERLRELRQKRKLTLRALCDTAGMSLAYLSDLERGLKVPSLTTLVRLAVALDCKLIHVMAGVPPADLAPDTAAALYAANLAWAGERGLAAGVKLVIEPLNPRDAPGYFLRSQEQGAAIVAAIGHDRIGLQFDIYHCQTAQGDVTTRLEKLLPVVDHMQLADVPGRHEPGTGEIGWEYVFRRIDELGYAGWIGCEYNPLGDTVAGLAWRRRYGV